MKDKKSRSRDSYGRQQRICRSKSTYRSLGAAKRHAKTMAMIHGSERMLRPYICDVCKSYHLSGNKKEKN